jgi:hypothetical protein
MFSWTGRNAGGCIVDVAFDDFDDDADSALDCFPAIVTVPCVCKPWD